MLFGLESGLLPLERVASDKSAEHSGLSAHVAGAADVAGMAGMYDSVQTRDPTAATMQAPDS